MNHFTLKQHKFTFENQKKTTWKLISIVSYIDFIHIAAWNAEIDNVTN